MVIDRKKRRGPGSTGVLQYLEDEEMRINQKKKKYWKGAFIKIVGKPSKWYLASQEEKLFHRE